MPQRYLSSIATSAALVVLVVAGTGLRGQPPGAGRWVTAWGASQHALGTNAITNATARLVARVTIPGDAVRIRLDNTFGAAPVSIGRAYVGSRVQGAALAAGSNRQALFGGAASVTIPPGRSVVSDSVAMKVAAWQDLAVSLYIPATGVTASQHSGAVVTSYVSANGSGDVAADEARSPFTTTTTSMLWLKAVDVLSTTAAGAIIAFGDSITDGTCATLDAHDRWEDWLAVRLQLDAAPRGAAGRLKAVVNEGIGGNTVTKEHLEPPVASPPGIERLDRDVFSHQGVTDVILFMGTNDIRRGASASQVMGGIADIVRRVKANSLRIAGVTIIPRHNVQATADNSGWNAGKTAIRHEVNQWIRAKAGFDAVIDFDKVVRDPANPDLMYPPFNCGDGIHPSPLGYYAMGNSLALDLFSGGPRATSRP